ncbi:unnamed protein product [marine sediment metagenome]|uniref:Uncharacterized protein n=1 Tax=marine sediment metagenome TaxID=412755 RepID=X1DJ08_9ZZZZ
MKEKQKYKLKKFKFPIDLIEFPIKYSNDLKVLKGKEKLLEFEEEAKQKVRFFKLPGKTGYKRTKRHSFAAYIKSMLF